jgi:hypothetical protein
MSRQRQQHDRDTLRGPNDKPQKPSAPNPSQAAITEVKHDFESIQKFYNEIVLAISHDRPLEYKLILGATEGIKKCADRLKKNLALPPPENKTGGKQKAALKEEEIKPTLRRLCLHIASFVMSPAFESLGVVDVEQSVKASRDLEEVIRLSELVWRSTSELRPVKE